MALGFMVSVARKAGSVQQAIMAPVAVASTEALKHGARYAHMAWKSTEQWAVGNQPTVIGIVFSTILFVVLAVCAIITYLEHRSYMAIDG